MANIKIGTLALDGENGKEYIYPRTDSSAVKFENTTVANKLDFLSNENALIINSLKLDKELEFTNDFYRTRVTNNDNYIGESSINTTNTSTDLISTDGYDKIRFVSNGNERIWKVAFYDENQTFLPANSYHTTGTDIVISQETIDIPSDAKYVSVSSYNYPGSATLINSKRIADNEYTNIKINCLGDSITLGKDGAVSSGVVEKPYPDGLKELLGCNTVRNYGISGSTLGGDNSTVGQNSFVSRYSSMDNDADIVIVWGGTNDYGSVKCVPLGEMGDTTNTTFYGSLDILINGLINKYVSSDIIFITPIKRQKTTENEHGFVLEDYVRAIINMCNKYSVTCFDAYHNFSVYLSNTTWKTNNMPDGLHPNQSFYNKIAEIMKAIIINKNSIPNSGAINTYNANNGIVISDIEITDEEVINESEYTSMINSIPKVVSVKKFNAKGDGTTDDRAAIQATIDYVSENGGGTVYLPNGRYMLDNRLQWKSNVSFLGESHDAVLATRGNNIRGFAAISWLDVNDVLLSGISNTNPYKNCNFENFAIDGSELSPNAYSSYPKGINIHYMEDCTFRNIYIHDTYATGLGIDFLLNVTVDSIKCYNCGRGYEVIESEKIVGGAGIGIATKAMNNESFTISNCITDGCGNYGIFVEATQIAEAENPQTKVVISDNIVQNGRKHGIIIKGTDNVTCTGNVCTNNYRNGIGIPDGQPSTYGANNIVISNNIIVGNQRGIELNNNTAITKNVNITNNIIHSNTGDGILMMRTMHNIIVTGNTIYNNNRGFACENINTYVNCIYGDNVCYNNTTANVYAQGNWIYGNIIDATNYIKNGIVDFSGVTFKSNTTINFPTGKYTVKKIDISNIDNLSINLNKSILTTSDDICIKLYSCKNVSIYDGTISNVGSTSLENTAGISLIGDCSGFNINNINIDGVNSGVISSDGYIHAYGIIINKSNSSNEYSKYGVINNCSFTNISGTDNGTTKADGDGIFIQNPPSLSGTNVDWHSDMRIDITNCYFNNCSKRGVKSAAYGVNINNCIFKGEFWFAAVDLQYGHGNVDNCYISNTSSYNESVTSCIVVSDGGVKINNCEMEAPYSNGTGTAFHPGVRFNTRLAASVVPSDYVWDICYITKCRFNKIGRAVYANNTSGDGNSYVIKGIILNNLEYGDLYSTHPVQISNTMFSEIKVFEYTDFSFTRGNKKADIILGNDTYVYPLSISSDVTDSFILKSEFFINEPMSGYVDLPTATHTEVVYRGNMGGVYEKIYTAFGSTFKGSKNPEEVTSTLGKQLLYNSKRGDTYTNTSNGNKYICTTPGTTTTVGTWVLVGSNTGSISTASSVNEVCISDTEPTDPNVNIWVDTSVDPSNAIVNSIDLDYLNNDKDYTLTFTQIERSYAMNHNTSYKYYESQAIDVVPGQKFRAASNAWGDNICVCAFFNNETYITNYRDTTNLGFKIYDIVVPEGVNKMKITPYCDASQDFESTYGYRCALVRLAGMSDIANKHNVLYNKKWYCCGDSYSQGDYTGSTSQYTFESGIYRGLNKVYSRYIAERNNMKLDLVAIGGATVGLRKTDSQISNAEFDPEQDTPGNTNNFFYTQYKKIKSDADYITFWFGINDSYTTDLGTIDDTTVHTFYGALDWSFKKLVTNFPKVKIGVIITNNCSSAYRQAIIEMAQKYALPYLDMEGDVSVPAISGRRENQTISVSSTVRQIRWKDTFRVSDSNEHPNEIAHEYQSTFIENFLRSL